METGCDTTMGLYSKLYKPNITTNAHVDNTCTAAIRPNEQCNGTSNTPMPNRAWQVRNVVYDTQLGKVTKDWQEPKVHPTSHTH
eukprot:3148647-Amphidinium_carterae.1